MYLIYYRPFEATAMNRLEIFNESCILAAAFHLISFTDFNGDPDVQYQGGWSIIAVTVLNMLMNMIVMVYASVRKLRLQLRLYKLKYERWKARRAGA